MSVQNMIAQMPLQHLSTAIVAGRTTDGNFVLSTHRDMDIKTLRALSLLIKDQIRSMKEDARYKAEQGVGEK